MKIAILTSGIRTVPAIQGGAVENLIDYYLAYNDKYRLHEITIYSIWHPDVKNHKALKSEVNHFHYIDTISFGGKIKKVFFSILHGEYYYHRSIEYFLHEAIRDIRKKNIDLIIVENRPGFILSLKRVVNTYCILHLHNDFLHIGIKSAQEIYEKTNRIISISKYITNRVNKIDPNSHKEVTVYNAIDNQKFYEAIAIKRNVFSISESEIVIVYSGRLNKEKGILHLIQAIKTLNSIPNLKLLIIGASNYGKDKYHTPFTIQLEKESESIKDKVIFTGFINYAELPSYLKMADIAVVPSMWEEPFGLTVVEAMAAGLPLVTTRSGGIPEICEGVATIVERDDIVNNLAQAILDLYEHPEKRQQMAAAGLERSKLFDKETYAKNFFAALEDI